MRDLVRERADADEPLPKCDLVWTSSAYVPPLGARAATTPCESNGYGAPIVSAMNLMIASWRAALVLLVFLVAVVSALPMKS